MQCAGVQARIPKRSCDCLQLQVSPKMSGLDHVVREVLFTQARNPGGPVLEVIVSFWNAASEAPRGCGKCMHASVQAGGRTPITTA